SVALKAAELLAAENISAEVVDLRTIRPLDTAAILTSVSKTHRCVVVEEGWPFAGVGAQVVDTIQREIFDELDAPVIRVTGADVPMPYNKVLERAAKADAGKTVQAVKKVMYID
ncbi:MAG: transketolase C-terminal domain-containing protein, partial [Gemmatimonadota bacterium]